MNTMRRNFTLEPVTKTLLVIKLRFSPLKGLFNKNVMFDDAYVPENVF